MAFNIYNTEYQSLNAKKMAELLSFATDDFAGVITTGWTESAIQTPTSYNQEKDSWCWNQTIKNEQITFVGGGINIGYDIPAINDTEGTGRFKYPDNDDIYIAGLDVIVPHSKASILSDNGRIWLTYVKCSSVKKTNRYVVVASPSGNPAQKGYYEYNAYGEYVITKNTTVESGKVYYYQIQNETFSVKDALFVDRTRSVTALLPARDFQYYGNTIWIQRGILYTDESNNTSTVDRFFIPICYRYKSSEDNKLHGVSMIFRRDKSSYQTILSADAYNNLLQECGDKFVWRTGGTTDYPRRGDIGTLNITGRTIKSIDDGLVIISKPKFINTTRIEDKKVGRRADGLTNLVVLDDGIPKKIHNNFVIGRSHGGTGANDINSARANMHFYSGRIHPAESSKDYVKRPKRLDGKTADIGAIYFKIIG